MNPPPGLEATGPTRAEGAEVDGSTNDDGSAHNHGDCAGELASATLHTILDGHAEVDEAEDDEDAAKKKTTAARKKSE